MMKIFDRIDQALSPIVFGDGQQQYDFIYVGDIARANILPMRSNATGKCYNIGRGIGTSIKELIELLSRLTGSDLPIEYQPSGQQTFVTNRIGFTEAAEQDLDFRWTCRSGRRYDSADRMAQTGFTGCSNSTRAGVEIILLVSMNRILVTGAGGYSGQGSLPNKETDVSFPDSAYGASKLCGEAWCRTFTKTSKMAAIQCLRLFNIYGTAADGSLRTTVESTFVRQLTQNQRPCIRGHAQDGRDFIHIDDVVQAFRLAVDQRTKSYTLNIGTGKCTTLTELSLMCARLVGRDIIPEHRYSMSDPIRFCADIAQAKKVLNYAPQIDLSTRLKRLIHSP